MSAEKKCGFVAIIGAPNAGKSSLLNALVGQKISIISHKVQTTRFPVKGIMVKNNNQIIFVDTPGIFAPKKRLDRAMVSAAWTGAKDADCLAHIIDAPSIYRAIFDKTQKGDKRNLEDFERINESLKEHKSPAILVFNKIDEIEKPKLLDLAQKLFDNETYRALCMVSVTKAMGLEGFSDEIAKFLPVSEFLYPEDQIADLPMRMMAAEITREKIFLRLHDELPYFTHVETDAWENRKDGSVRIDQTLYVGKEGHKPIVIGKNGETLKWISTQARHEIAREIECPVHLFLHVKVRENWLESRQAFNNMGLDFDS